MKSTILVAAALVGLANSIPESSLHLKHMGAFRPRDNQGVELPATAPSLNIQTVQGCFSSSGDLKFDSNQTYNSISSCVIGICLAGGYAVGGTSGGKECWCGNTYPALDTLVKDSECNTPCTGYGLQACGGADTWTIYNTGLSVSVKYMPNTTSSQSSASSSAPATAVVTLGGQTVIVTQAAAAASSDASTSSGGGSSVGGIVAGVVVGVVVIASAVGGVFLYMRRRRNQELEEEFRRNASVNDFFGKPPGSSGGMSATDSRLDPVLAHRRMSDGSIADNQDYSRRILRVTNA